MEHIQVEIMSPTGMRETCEIRFAQRGMFEMEVCSQHFGSVSFTDRNLFAALLQFRLRLEKDGYSLLCNAARRDAYPSRMSLEMGGGRKIYLLKLGVQAKREDLVDIFAPASIEQVCSVADQRKNYEKWIESLR